jgi:hypothetical protein
LFLEHTKSGIFFFCTWGEGFQAMVAPLPVRGLMLSLAQSSLEESAMMLQ